MDRQYSLSAIAAGVGGTLRGDGNVTVRTVSTLEDAEDGAISWIGNKEMAHRAESTKACALLIPSDLAITLPIPTIAVADPELALCTVLTFFAPQERPPFEGVDPRATVAADASVDGASIAAGALVGPRSRIGAGTVLYPGVFVGADCTIGAECTLWPNVVVRERCSLGDRVIVHPNATIGADGFGYLLRDGVHVKIPQIGRVVIEDDVEIGANTTIDRARSGETRIGRGTKIDNLVQIAHNCHVAEHCIFVAQSGIAGSSSLGHHVILAARAGVADHVDVGPGAQLAAGTGLFKNAPAGAKIGGFPAVDFVRYLKLQATLRRLPQLVQRLKDAEKRLAALEESAASGATEEST